MMQYAIIELKNGKKRKEEFYYGASYLSQSSRFLNIRCCCTISANISTEKEKAVLLIFKSDVA